MQQQGLIQFCLGAMTLAQFAAGHVVGNHQQQRRQHAAENEQALGVMGICLLGGIAHIQQPLLLQRE